MCCEIIVGLITWWFLIIVDCAKLAAAKSNKKSKSEGGDGSFDFFEYFDAVELSGIFIGGIFGLFILCVIIEVCRQCCLKHECCPERERRNRVNVDPERSSVGANGIYYLTLREGASAVAVNRNSSGSDSSENSEQSRPPYDAVVKRNGFSSLKNGRNMGVDSSVGESGVASAGDNDRNRSTRYTNGGDKDKCAFKNDKDKSSACGDKNVNAIVVEDRYSEVL